MAIACILNVISIKDICCLFILIAIFLKFPFVLIAKSVSDVEQDI